MKALGGQTAESALHMEINSVISAYYIIHADFA
jgi:hypothetical protein